MMSIAQTPHSPRWQSDITSKPASLSASSIDLFSGTTISRLELSILTRNDSVGKRPLEPNVS
jgi:hypothetical protein